MTQTRNLLRQCFKCFNVIIYVVIEMVLGQVATFSRTNCNVAVSYEACHSGRRSVGKVPPIVVRMAINKRFVIDMIVLITVFA